MAQSSPDWLDIDEVAARLGVSGGKIRRLIQDRSLLATKRDGRLVIPEAFLDGDAVVRDLRGTVTVLIDGGFSDDEALRWLLEPHSDLGVSPIEAITQGRKSEVRRLAQSLAL